MKSKLILWAMRIAEFEEDTGIETSDSPILDLQAGDDDDSHHKIYGTRAASLFPRIQLCKVELYEGRT